MTYRLTPALLFAIALAAGCSSGSDSSPTNGATPANGTGSGASGTTLAGTVEEAAQAGIVVCLDQDSDLQCSATEPRASTDAEGRFSLALATGTNLSGLQVIAEVPAAAADAAGIPADVARPAAPATATTALVLAAPAAQTITQISETSQATVTIHALSTLVSASMLANPGQAPAAAQAAVRQQAQLPAGVVLLDSYGSDSSGHSKTFGSYVAPALRAGLQSAANATPPATPAATTIAAAKAIEASLARYLDVSTGLPYWSVSPRTIVSETTAVTGAATTCATAAPFRIQIDTANAAPIVDRENYLQGTLTIAASPAFPAGFSASTQIRGRGNSTWLQAPKKPYRIKLTEKAALLGGGSARDWALLANYFDRSMLRNSHAFCLSRLTGAEYTPAHQFVEVTLNGQDIGLYLLTDQIEPGTNRVNLGEVEETDVDPPFLVEIDTKRDSDPEEMFESALGFPYAVKSDATVAQVAAIQGHIAAFETALSTLANPLTTPRVSDLLDTDTLVDFYVITEYLRNNDTFISSTYVHQRKGGKLIYGPHWDYDLSAGNSSENGNSATDGWWVRTVNSMYGAELPGGYITRLLADPAFAAHVAARWHFLESQQATVFAFLDSSAATIADAQQRNLTIWPPDIGNGIYAEYVTELKTWLTARRNWLDTQMPASR